LVLRGCKSYKTFDTVRQLAAIAVGDADSNSYEVKYSIPGKGEVTEAVVHRVNNGISANYPDPYMRRRDPDTMAIADDLPSDKERFNERFGYEFDSIEKETMNWLKEQDLAIFFYFAGRDQIGSGGIAIVPSNTGFFAMGLSMLQSIVPVEDLPNEFTSVSAIFIESVMSRLYPNQTSIHEYKV